MADGLRRGVHELAGQIEDAGAVGRRVRCPRERPLDLHVAKAVIGETRMPDFAAAALQRVGKRVRPAGTALRDEPVPGQQFAGDELDAAAGRPFTVSCGTGEVLPEVVDQDAGLGLRDLGGLELPHHLDGRRRLRRRAARRGRPPRAAGHARGLEARLVPARHFLPRVVVFAAVDAGEGDRGSAAAFQDSSLATTVDVPSCVFDIEMQDDLGRAEGAAGTSRSGRPARCTCRCPASRPARCRPRAVDRSHHRPCRGRSCGSWSSRGRARESPTFSPFRRSS